MIGLGIFVSWASGASEASQLASAFTTRVVADGGTVESKACLTTDLTYLTNNPVAPDFTGLLNDYSGAAAAYSLRLLDNTYSGNAVRVRRASDNAEQDIGFANNELDTTSLETFCSGTDGFVTTWYDQSGNAGNLSSSTAANQPQIVSSGTSLGYIQSLVSTILNSTTPYINGTNYSTFFVGQNLARTVWGTDQSVSFYAVADPRNSQSSVRRFTEGNRYSNGSLIGATWGDMYNALTSFAQVTALVLKTTDDSNIRIGFSNYNNGRYKEYIIYPNQTISRTGVETNIIDHYNF